ncbi:hypothetical protein [Variovorax guangxiensis]|uniref:Uncharacterized protein n=1 Tax=Variovorax guangxiensis TaxID=1775474 RepID=A0A840FIB7_9BURK|nr:hypothetical protein [Variovorax guangxiensis]MBB4219399.1 hypothetical protein [Variovorax guangxiensis]
MNSQSFNRNFNISFLQEARSVLGEPPKGDQYPRQIGPCSQVGDFVRFPGSTALFVVVERIWTYGEDFEGLEIVLGLAAEPTLTVVK